MDYLLQNEYGGLLAAPGLGKTLMTLAAFAILKKTGLVKNMLIMAKLRICYSVWPKEVSKWGFDFKIAMLHGSKKDDAFDEDADIYIINYEGLSWLEGKLKKNPYKFDMVVADESTKIKNTNTKRFKAIRKMVKHFKRRYILTGSPIPNNLQDIFGQAFFIDLGKTFGQYITQFRLKYFYPTGYQGYEWKVLPEKEKEIYEKLSHITLRMPKSLLKLPPLHIVDRKVILPDEAMKIYKEVEDEFISLLEDGVVRAVNAGSKSGKLRQITGGAVYGSSLDDILFEEPQTAKERRKVIAIHDEKIEEVKEIVEELQGSPCIVAYYYNHELERLQKAFPDAPHIGGGVSPKKSVEIEDRWNRGEIPVLLGHPDSIAHGLNLQESGYTIIIMTAPWDLESYEQLIQRLWRQGQQNPVTVINLVAEGTVDELVVRTLRCKDATQQTLLNELERYYLKRTKVVVMADEKVIQLFKETTEREGMEMPIFYKDSPKTFVADLARIVNNWHFDVHKQFIETVTGGVCNEKELMRLAAQSRSIILNAFDIEEATGTIGNEKLLKKYASGVKSRPPKKDKQPEYLKGESKMSESKFAKKKSAKKKTAAKKSVPAKKKAAVKKTASVKKKTAVKSSASSAKAELLKLLQRKSGVSVKEAAEKLSKTEGNIRSMIGALRKSGTEVENLGKGVFKA